MAVWWLPFLLLTGGPRRPCLWVGFSFLFFFFPSVCFISAFGLGIYLMQEQDKQFHTEGGGCGQQGTHRLCYLREYPEVFMTLSQGFPNSCPLLPAPLLPPV